MRSLPLLAVVLVGACQPQAAPLSQADQVALRAVGDSFAHRVRRADFSATAALYATDAHFMPPNQPALAGRDAILAWMTAFPPISAFELAVDEVAGQGEVAYVRGRYAMAFTPPGARAAVADTGKFLAVHRRQPDGSWPMVEDIFNSDLPPPKQ